MPSSPLGELVSITTPLGDLYNGHCAVDPSIVIASEMLRLQCNFGHARGLCERAKTSDADADRFLVKADSGSVVEIAWAVERNHHPIATGTIEIAVDAAGPAATEPLHWQAYACARSYLRRTRTG
jgi:hypothetical protein